MVEDDNQLDTYNWSGPPGLHEQTDEIAKSIHRGGLSSFQRTISSSSTTSSTTGASKQKRKKLNNTNQNDIDELTILDENSMSPPSSTSTRPLAEIGDGNNKNIVQDESPGIINNYHRHYF